MGNSQSNKRVTITNDDVVGYVQVSDNVVRRFKGMPDKKTETSEESRPSEPPPKVSPPPSPKFVPFAPPEPFSSTMEQRQKYHEEFKRAEVSWNNRINELEAQNQTLYEAAKQNFAGMLSDVDQNYVKNSFAPVCPDKQVQVERCFKENNKLPLSCSREVKDFMDCVDKIRMTAISK